MEPTGIKIIPDYKEKLGIKASEYILISIIYNFSRGGSKHSRGYFGSIVNLGRFTGNTDDTVRSDIKKLIAKGYLEEKYNQDGKYSLYITQKFARYYQTEGKVIPNQTEILVSKAEKSGHKNRNSREEKPRFSVHNNKDNSKKNNKIESPEPNENIRFRTPSFNSGEDILKDSLLELFSEYEVFKYYLAEKILEDLINDFKSLSEKYRAECIADLKNGKDANFINAMVSSIQMLEEKLSSEHYRLEESNNEEKDIDDEIDSFSDYITAASKELFKYFIEPDRKSIAKLFVYLRSLDDQDDLINM